jgi:predicted DNA-binding transcriptional regulator AlpA
MSRIQPQDIEAAQARLVSAPPAVPDALMDPRTCAAYLGVSALSLADWRCKQVGPPFIKCGAAVRYRRSAVEAWLESRTRKGA